MELGIDLGSNSIGWAIVDKANNQIVNTGVRIFPEGVENYGQGEKEKSHNAQRRENRGKRKQFFRKKLRKKLLLRLLADSGMAPVSKETVNSGDLKLLTSMPEMRDWFMMNPYELRSQAVKGKISLPELGRVFYHLSQRRGFQSNSRYASDESSVLYDEIGKNEEKTGKAGIVATEKAMNGRSLGETLYDLYPQNSVPYNFSNERIRNRYTKRSMYIDEFNRIWYKQSESHKGLTDGLKQKFGAIDTDSEKNGVLFYQRKLRSQKKLIGKCTFEPKKSRSPISTIDYEYFRVYQFINTIEYNGNRLNESEREIAVKLLLSKEYPKISELRKKLGLHSDEYKFNYKDDHKMPGAFTLSKLSSRKFFGKEWFEKPPKEQEDIWHVVFSFDDISRLKKYAIDVWGFPEESAEGISKWKPRQGYSSLSRKAIKNILPFLKLGYQYHIAVVLGGVKNAFGREWENLDDNKKKLLFDNIEDIIEKPNKGGFITGLKEFLKTEYSLSEKQLSKLYHHSSNINTREILDKLPVGPDADRVIQSIKNPVVVKGLFELRKLVNALIDEYGSFDQINIELARDLKASSAQRLKMINKNKELEEKNEEAIQELRNIPVNVSHENILRYRLWKECQHTCPYSGRPIPIEKLFSSEVQIEHIVPYSRSLDDSFMNKTLCYEDINREKGKRTPFEYYSTTGNGAWAKAKQVALSIFYDSAEFPARYQKFKRFVRESVIDDDNFIARQLNDTRYLSREAKNYLSQVCNRINVPTGQHTANLRKKWGLNNVLSKSDEKERDDHRHHAIDALVVACMDRHFMQELSKWNRYSKNYQMKKFPHPWPSFMQDAEQSINEVLVSYSKKRKILVSTKVKTKKNGKFFINNSQSARGQLHKESIYGKRMSLYDGKHHYHIRKPLENITTQKQVEKIVDPVIRKRVKDHVATTGEFIFFRNKEGKKKIPILFLPNKNGDDVPIRKVRVTEEKSNAELLYEEVSKTAVDPRKNHHVLIYENEDGQLCEDITSFWKVVERKLQGQQLFTLPAGGKKIMAKLMINEMFVIGLSDEKFDELSSDVTTLSPYLYRVQKVSSGDYCFRHHLRSTLNSSKPPELIRIQSLKSWSNYNPIQVEISFSGKMKRLSL